MLKDLNEISQTLDRATRQIRARLAALERENEKMSDAQDRIERLMQGVKDMERRLKETQTRLDALEHVWPGATDESNDAGAVVSPERNTERKQKNA